MQKIRNKWKNDLKEKNYFEQYDDNSVFKKQADLCQFSLIKKYREHKEDQP